MKIARIPGPLADPATSAWREVETATVALAPVAREAQPNTYIREAWAGRPYGETPAATLAAASDGERLFVRIEWADGAAPHGEFQDAAAAIFPTGEDGQLATLGDQAAPLELWYWQDGRPAPLRLSSRGPGVVRKESGNGIAGTASLSDGRWGVVLAGPLPPGASRIGVAIWNGSNDERGGLAAVSQAWLPLELA